MNWFWAILQKLIVLAIWVVILTGVVYAVRYEMRTSVVQSELFSRYAANMNYEMGEGRNPDLLYPKAGPYDLRMGYNAMPRMLDNLEAQGYEVLRQPRMSQPLTEFIQLGGFAIYNEKTSAGLTIYDRAGGALHSVKYPTRVFDTYEKVPPLIAQTLLFIENRELLDEGTPFRNPSVEWDRFFVAAVGQLAKKINPHINMGGGSTLATQIEKFRHSPEGRTEKASEKIQQMLTASVRSYRQGPDTMNERRRIVLDYLNSTPLTARGGIGEVNGLGDGLYAWFGTELSEVEDVLSRPAADLTGYRRQAEVYKQALSLMLAQRRPSYYLLTDRKALDKLCNTYLNLLAQAGIINPAMAELAATIPLVFKEADPTAAAPNWITLKAANAVRLNLLKLLGVNSLYELDRIDATVHSTLDSEAQKSTIELLQSLATKEGATASGMVGFRLFGPDNDFTKVVYSVVLYERMPYGNAVRVQADNLDKPLDLNEGAKLDLGSTAKLRTLASYLEFIGDIYDRYKDTETSALQAVNDSATDNLTRFVASTLIAKPKITLNELLDLAMERTYSGNTGEVFFTGGGIHSFVNFEKWEDARKWTVTDALANSVNLAFIRIMADVRDYLIAQGPITKKEIFGDPDHPARQAYLARFADREGRVFLGRYYDDYQKLTADQMLEKLLSRSRKNLSAQATVFRSVMPEASYAAFTAFIRDRQKAGIQTAKVLDASGYDALYRNYGIDKYNLTDRGYIAGVNPLELWLVDYLRRHPKANREEVMQASVEQRQQTYSWLFQTRFRGAQDTRIRILIEQDAFARLHDHWAKLGYPFSRLVPSLATSIGSSADRPGALADLMGIIVNNGRKLPTVRVEDIELAKDTPYEAFVKLRSKEATDDGSSGSDIGEQVMRPETAAHLRTALAGVVENGTAKRVNGVYKDNDGKVLTVGGKTGTGDHRYEVYGAGGRLISSRAVERTGTFVFYIGNRFFGTITAHVEGEIADSYKFTSALSAQLLKSLAPAIQKLVAQQGSSTADPKPKATIKPAGEEAGEEPIEENVTPVAPDAIAPSATPTEEPTVPAITSPAPVAPVTPSAAQPATRPRPVTVKPAAPQQPAAPAMPPLPVAPAGVPRSMLPSDMAPTGLPPALQDTPTPKVIR